jgi:Zn finger protein HypA/HybF involved in hydrogenase expression
VPRRECLDCRRLTTGTRCPHCTSAMEQHRDQIRGNSAARGYDEQWRKLVALAIAAQPWCSDCGIGRQQARADGNPLSGDHLRWPALTLNDVDVCCRSCNSARGAIRGSTARPRSAR